MTHTGAMTTAAGTRHTGAARAEPRVPWPVKYAVLVLVWGSSFLLMKVGLSALAPVQMSTLRILTGTVVLLGLLRLSRGRLPRSWAVWRHLLVVGVCLSALPFTLFALSETRISSALAGIGNSTTPIATVIASSLLLRADPVPPRKIVAVVVGFLGVVLIAAPWTAADRPDLVGFAMAVGGGASYGLGWAYQRRFLHGVDLGGVAQPTAVLLVGSACIVPVALVSWWLDPERLATPWSVHPPTGGYAAWLPVLAVLALGAVGTGLAFMWQYDVVRAAGPVVGATVTYLIPIVSVLLGVLVLGEHLTWTSLAGFAVVLGAAFVVNAPSRPSAAGSGRLRERRARRGG